MWPRFWLSLYSKALRLSGVVTGKCGNVTKGRLGSGQGCNERKVTYGAGVGSGCGVTRRRRYFAIIC